MTISEEEFKKMFDLVRELHENYTKNVEKENENLRIMLADAQRRLDEALATIEKLKHGNNEESLNKWREVQERMGVGTGTRIWTSPSTIPYSPDPNQPYITWTTSNTSQAHASDGWEDKIDSYKKFKEYMSSKMQSKADEDG